MKKLLTVVALIALTAGASLLSADEANVAKVGDAAPEFTLSDLDGEEHSLASYKGKIVVLEWFNPDCPIVKKHHESNKTMKETFADYHGKDVVWLAINSGAPGKQGHGLERNQRSVGEYAIEYPILLDESGEVGRLYGARTTPHMYVIDAEGTLRYGGAIDDKKGAPGETNYVRLAVDALLAGGAVEVTETRPYGCSVRYGK